MDVKKHNTFFFIIVCILVFVLFKTTALNKLSNIFFSLREGINPTYGNFLLIAYFVFFHIFFYKKQRLKVLLYTFITAFLSFVLGILSFGLVMKYIHYLDQQRTPIGWDYDYQWFSMIFVCVYLIFSIEFINRKVRK